MTTITMPSIAAGTYALDTAKSTVTFSVKSLFGLVTVRGNFTVKRAEAYVDAEPQRCYVDAVLDAASFHTGNPRRDKDIRSARFLDVANHAELTFCGTGVRLNSDGTATMNGELIVKGQCTKVTLTLLLGECVTTESGFRCSAECVIDRYATAVTAGKGLIGRELQLRFDLTFAAK
jgi:polyisoprenoid-binding protein YceI